MTTALATFAELPTHRSDGPSSTLPNSSITSPVARHNKTGLSSFDWTRVSVVGTSGKYSCVPWGSGGMCESVSSGKGGMTAAVLSAGGVFMDKRKKEKGDRY